jgi:hypothetical protein
MKQNIVEITKGKTGTGLLLENDGYVSLELPGNKKLYESIKLNEATGQRNFPEKLIFDTVFQKFDTPNANGRIYPEAILKREVEKYQQAIKERRAYGEANHPESSTIDLSRIGMNIIELHWEGKTLVGKIEIPITDGYRNFGIVSTCADQVAHWILSGLKIGVSSRGLGSVTQRNGILYVGEDFEIICWDVVTQPSTPNAWICTEEGEISLYKENVEMNNNKTIFNENIENKYSKFEKWLND